MSLDKTGLESRIFEGLSITSRRKYIYACNMQTGVSRWSKHAIEDFGMPGEYFVDGAHIWGDKLHPDDRERY